MEIFKFGINWNLSFFLLFLFIGLIVSFLCRQGIKKNDKGCLLGAFIILFIFDAFRSVNVGTDTIEYVEFFEWSRVANIQDLLYTRFEPLFCIYVYLISRVASSYVWLFSINAVITNGALLYFIKNNWKPTDSFMFLPLFVINYQYDMSAMRSSLAVAFILISFVLINKNKTLPALLFSLVSVFFHYTSVFAFLIVLVQFVIQRYKQSISAKFLIALFSIFAITIYQSMNILESYINESQYSGYIQELGSGWFGYWYLFLCAIFSVYIIICKSRRREDIGVCEIANLLVLSALPVYVILNAYRIPKYFLMSRCVTYKDYYTSVKRKNNIPSIIAFFILIIVLIFFFTRINSGTYYEFNSDIL